MKIKPGCAEEYKRRHDEIWPDLKDEISRAGIQDYSIYLDDNTGMLYASMKLSDGHDAGSLPQNPVVRKWWSYMADIMETNPDNSPLEIPVREVFHMD